jgi:DNA sulfur modification protein DndD
MKIQKLIINNFMPYKGEQVIDFPQHETQNVMLVFGDNMRGKTSFLNTIRWGFYGYALGRHMKKITRIALVNREAIKEDDWTMSVSLLFEHEGKSYELNRNIEKLANVPHPSNHSDFKELIGLRINGAPIDGDSINNEINQVMPKDISQFFLFDGELLQEYEKLMEEENAQGEKIKEDIESILGVPALIHAREELQVLLKNARTLQRKYAQKNEELKAFANNQKEYEVQFESIEGDISVLNGQRNELQNKINKIEDELRNTEAVQNKKIELSGLEEKKRGFENSVKQYNNENQFLLKSVWKDVLANSVKDLTNKLKKERDSAQKEMEDASILQATINNLQKSLEEDKICNTCGQDIPESKQAALRDELKKCKLLKSDKETNHSQLSELTRKIDILEGLGPQGEIGRIINNSGSIKKIKVNLMAIENERDDIFDEIKDFDTDHIMRQRDQLGKLQRQFIKIGNDIDDQTKLRTEISDKQRKISGLITKHKGFEDSISNRRVDKLEQLESIFLDGINQLRIKLKGDVALHATRAFKKLITEKTYAGLEINPNYGLSILDQNGEIVIERSAGAEQIVALSLIDGLNKTSGTKAPIVMDTPLGRLDLKHRKNLLKYCPDMAEQVVLIVHEGEMRAEKDTKIFAERIGAKYEIKRISASQSRIERM